MNGWIEITTCINCNGNLQPYRAVTTAPYLMVDFCGGALPVSTTSTFSKCTACGLVAQSPRMTDDRIAQYYSSGLYRQTLGIPVEAMDADELRRAQDVMEWLYKHGIKNPASHADIGASRGFLLQEIGARTQRGFDTNPKYGDYKLIENDRYDLVTAIHVLEHTTSPIEEIKWYKSLSADKVLIEVPGENCKGGPLRFAHLYYFPPNVLANMMQDAGLKILEIETEPNTRILAEV
ncbi:MAG: class I SAM-dependent methyltransferase [Candidatus Berkelbacteria bacterium]|nr:class I SAM-dependent methyltransferase [Candidatus Berkelbacteria bacterium]